MLYWYFSFSIHRYNVLHVLRSQSLPGLLFFLCVWSLVFIMRDEIKGLRAVFSCGSQPQPISGRVHSLGYTLSRIVQR